MKRYPPDEKGNYTCWICNNPVSVEAFTMDHILPQGDYPEYAKELSNIKPAHRFCNEERGRKDHSKLLKRFGRTRVRR